MIVVDTTVLVCAVGVDHPLRDPCQRLVAAVRDGRLAVTTTVEVLQELTHVRARRRPREDAAALARNCADLLTPLLPVQEASLRRGLRLFERHERLGAFDAVLAAAALDAGAEGLVSADGAFADVDGLRHLVPGSAELERLVT